MSRPTAVCATTCTSRCVAASKNRSAGEPPCGSTCRTSAVRPALVSTRPETTVARSSGRKNALPARYACVTTSATIEGKLTIDKMPFCSVHWAPSYPWSMVAGPTTTLAFEYPLRRLVTPLTRLDGPLPWTKLPD